MIARVLSWFLPLLFQLKETSTISLGGKQEKLPSKDGCPWLELRGQQTQDRRRFGFYCISGVVTIDATKKSATMSGAKFPFLMDDGYFANKFRISYEMTPAIRKRLELTSLRVLWETSPIACRWQPPMRLVKPVSCDYTKRAEPMKTITTLLPEIIHHKRKLGPFSVRLGN
jgi:hypothetical protein